MDYTAGRYRDNSGRYRWAVLQIKSSTWIFPSRYGKKAAEALAKKLNKEAS